RRGHAHHDRVLPLAALEVAELAHDVGLALAGQLRVLRIGGVAVGAVAGAADGGLAGAGGRIAGLGHGGFGRRCRLGGGSGTGRRGGGLLTGGRGRRARRGRGILRHGHAARQGEDEGYHACEGSSPKGSRPETGGPKTHTLVSRKTALTLPR